MNDSKISVRYSKALFQSAVEKKLLEKVYDDMLFIGDICRMEELKDVLSSPIITPSKKTAILHGVLEKNIEKITMSLVDLLIKNGRENYLPAVVRVFRDETLKFRGITPARLTTAIPVDEKTKKKISDLISSVFKTKVELTETIDPEIVGGFIIRINDNFIDASVKNKLRKIKKELSVRMSENE